MNDNLDLILKKKDEEAAAEAAKQKEELTLSKEERKAEARAGRDDFMRWFQFEKLPEPVRTVVEAYAGLANGILTLPQCAERTVAMRKLLESKDAAIRALMY